ncbi:MAG: hypothetical protein HRS57_02725, partial [Mycoplasmataceae bacterium]|nr:hypothetical protein [Mycoplasmataceae bacterium]
KIDVFIRKWDEIQFEIFKNKLIREIDEFELTYYLHDDFNKLIENSIKNKNIEFIVDLTDILKLISVFKKAFTKDKKLDKENRKYYKKLEKKQSKKLKGAANKSWNKITSKDKFITENIKLDKNYHEMHKLDYGNKDSVYGWNVHFIDGNCSNKKRKNIEALCISCHDGRNKS